MSDKDSETEPVSKPDDDQNVPRVIFPKKRSFEEVVGEIERDTKALDDDIRGIIDDEKKWKSLNGDRVKALMEWNIMKYGYNSIDSQALRWREALRQRLMTLRAKETLRLPRKKKARRFRSNKKI